MDGRRHYLARSCSLCALTRSLQSPRGWRCATRAHARTVLVYPTKRDFCDPIAAVRAWRSIGGIDHGYVFRSMAPDGQVTDRPLSCRASSMWCAMSLPCASLNANSLQAGWIATALGDGCPLVKVHTYTRIPTERLTHDSVRAYAAPTPCRYCSRAPVPHSLWLATPLASDPSRYLPVQRFHRSTCPSHCVAQSSHSMNSGVGTVGSQPSNNHFPARAKERIRLRP